MTMYQKMKRIAKPIVKNYWDDLAVHDLKAVRAMKPYMTAIWAPRENGTYLHRCSISDAECSNAVLALRAAKVSLDFFDAECAQHPGLQWYLLEKIGEAVIPIDQSHARSLLERRLYAAQMLVRNAPLTPSEVA